MQFGISTFFYTRKPVLEVIHEALSWGITTIELMYDLPQITQMDERCIESLCAYRGQGMTFSMHAPFLEVNIGSYFKEIRNLSLKRIKKAIDVASQIGCDPVILHSGYTFLYKIEDIRRTTEAYCIEDLRDIVHYAQERNVRTSLENVYMPYFFLSSPIQFRQFQREIPEIGFALDMGHAFLSKRLKNADNPEDAILNDIDVIGIENIFHVHIHNNSGIRDDHLFLNGDMDLRKLLKGLSEKGYDGKVIIESYDVETYGMERVLDKLQTIVP